MYSAFRCHWGFPVPQYIGTAIANQVGHGQLEILQIPTTAELAVARHWLGLGFTVATDSMLQATPQARLAVS